MTLNAYAVIPMILMLVAIAAMYRDTLGRHVPPECDLDDDAGPTHGAYRGPHAAVGRPPR